MLTKLPYNFYARDPVAVARDLLGKALVRNLSSPAGQRRGGIKRVGRIVETEAYLGPHDWASHSSRGRTKRTAPLFGPVGRCYVYLIYGMYDCLNVVVGTEGRGAAVLIRALEPIQNCAGKTSGPGLLCRALNITRALNGHDLQDDALFIAESDIAEADAADGPRRRSAPIIVARPRIGVDYAGRWSRRLLRFYLKDNHFISRV